MSPECLVKWSIAILVVAITTGVVLSIAVGVVGLINWFINMPWNS